MFTNRKLDKDQLTLFTQVLDRVEKETWTSKNLFRRSSCPATVRKLFWAL